MTEVKNPVDGIPIALSCSICGAFEPSLGCRHQPPTTAAAVEPSLILGPGGMPRVDPTTPTTVRTNPRTGVPLCE